MLAMGGWPNFSGGGIASASGSRREMLVRLTSCLLPARRRENFIAMLSEGGSAKRPWENETAGTP
jgi:hypothetical protein